MPSTIKLKTGSGVPLIGDLVAGEVALDLTNARIYTENNSGSVIELGANPTTVDTSTVNATQITVTGITLNGDLTATGTLSGSNYNNADWDAAFGDKINSASFNTVDGVLTLTQQDGGTVTVDLDGRYEVAGAGSIDYITGGTFNTTTGELSLTGVGAAGATVDLDGRYIESFNVRANAAATDAISNADTLTFADGTNTTVNYDSATNTFSIDSTDTNTNTTYSLSAAQTSGNNADPNLFLNASSGTDYNVQLIGTGATTVTRNADNQITINSTNTDTNTTYTAGSGLDLTGTTFSHTDTSSQGSVNNSGRFVIQDITLDSFGHITSITSTELADNNTTYSAGALLDLTGTTFAVDLSELTDMTAGVVGSTDELVLLDSGLQRRKAINEINLGQFNNDQGWTSSVGDITNVTANAPLTGGGTSGSVSIGLGTTGPGAATYGSTANGTKIDTITLDAYGRVTAIATGATGSSSTTGTVTSVSGANGISGTVTTSGSLTLDSDLRSHVFQIGRDTNDYYIVNTTTHSWYLDNAEDMRLTNTGQLDVEGNIVAFSTTVSDERLKDNVETIANPLDTVSALRGVTFEWNKGHREGQKDIGVIAQEVQAVLPELIVEAKDSLIDGEDYLTVSYGQMAGLFIECFKEVIARLEALENK